MSAKVPLDILMAKEGDLQAEIGKLLETFTGETGFVVSKVALLKHRHGAGYAVRVESELRDETD